MLIYTCPTCNGEKEINGKTCPQCEGAGRMQDVGANEDYSKDGSGRAPYNGPYFEPEFENLKEGDRVCHRADPELHGTVESDPDTHGIFFVQWDSGVGGDYWISDARVALLDTEKVRK